MTDFLKERERFQFEYYKSQAEFLLKDAIDKEMEIAQLKQQLDNRHQRLYKEKEEIERSLKSNESLLEEYDSSILYSSYIQNVILGDQSGIRDFFGEIFTYYKPRKMVSGDFYWFNQLDNDSCIVVVGDSSGHGVPGGLMTILAINLLNEITVMGEANTPNLILNQFNQKLMNASHGLEDLNLNHHFELTVLLVNRKDQYLSVASTQMNSYLISGNKLKVLKPSGVKLGVLGESEFFQETFLKIREEDQIVLSTNGLVIQRNSEGQMLSEQSLENTLLRSSKNGLDEMKLALEGMFMKWKGEESQSDDILVIGLKL